MTEEESRDAREGRVNRELREAQAELSDLLLKATHLAKDITSLAGEITNRVARARQATGNRSVAPEGLRLLDQSHDAGIEFGRLKRYEKCVDLAAIDALDREIGQAVAKLLNAQQQKALLGT
jgi:hypothetical protein